MRIGDKYFVEANGQIYEIDASIVELDLMKMPEPMFRADGLCSDEYDVSLVPEHHVPVRLVTHKVDLFPDDRRRLNNQLIAIFGTKHAVKFRTRQFGLALAGLKDDRAVAMLNCHC
jgi:hypothetical protein